MALEQRRKVLEQLSVALNQISDEQVDCAEKLILSSNELFCCGNGRSGLSAHAFAMRLMHMGLQVSIVGDVLSHVISKGDLLILVSASGSSKSLLHTAMIAKNAGANLLLITANSKSVLTEVADACVLIPTNSKEDMGEDRVSVSPLGSLFEETSFVLFDMIVLDIMNQLHLTNEDLLARHANLE